MFDALLRRLLWRLWSRGLAFLPCQLTCHHRPECVLLLRCRRTMRSRAGTAASPTPRPTLHSMAPGRRGPGSRPPPPTAASPSMCAARWKGVAGSSGIGCASCVSLLHVSWTHSFAIPLRFYVLCVINMLTHLPCCSAARRTVATWRCLPLSSSCPRAWCAGDGGWPRAGACAYSGRTCKHALLLSTAHVLLIHQSPHGPGAPAPPVHQDHLQEAGGGVGGRAGGV